MYMLSLIIIYTSRKTSITCYINSLKQCFGSGSVFRIFLFLGRKIINPSGGYMVDIHRRRSAHLIRFVAPLLAKDRRVVFISLAGSGARRSLATNRISSGGYPPEGFMIFRPGKTEALKNIRDPTRWKNFARIEERKNLHFLILPYFQNSSVFCRKGFPIFFVFNFSRRLVFTSDHELFKTKGLRPKNKERDTRRRVEETS